MAGIPLDPVDLEVFSRRRAFADEELNGRH